MSRAAAKPKAIVDLVEVFDVESHPQGGDAWFTLRLGMATASNFATIMADGRDGEASKTRTELLYRLAGEILSKQPAETYENEAMRRGRTMEAALVADYEFKRQVEVEHVGFVRRTIKRPPFSDLVVGCSPDGLVGKDGGLQVKSMKPELICRMVDSGRFPSEHRAQCQGEMWVTGRQWWDLKVGYKDMPLGRTFRLERDEAYIAQNLRPAVERFDYDLRQLVERIKAKGLQ